jgi:putative ABC transport system permease protein
MGALIALVVGAVIVYQILYTDVSDHLGEYATLKAMGYSDRQLYTVVLEQAVILSALGFPIGFLLAQILYIGARNATNLPLEMTVARTLMVLAFAFIMCIGSGFLALRKLQSADPAEVF